MDPPSNATSSTARFAPATNPSVVAPCARLYHEKLGQILWNPQAAQNVTWDSSRIVTPGQHIALVSGTEIKMASFAQESILLFHSFENSQGLMLDPQGAVLAATVTTRIARQVNEKQLEGTPIKKKKKREGAYVKYDAGFIQGGDFQVTHTRKGKQGKDKPFYQSCHLIDHQFQAGLSNRELRNYYPGHYYLNHPLKNYLVTKCDAFIEIPVYTPSPPYIQAKVSSKPSYFQPIPIVVLIITIQKDQIENVYCFPNNNYNYKTIITTASTASPQILPHFMLKKAMHALLTPALVHTLRQDQSLPREQHLQEKRFQRLYDKLAEGTSAKSWEKTTSVIARLAKQVLRKNHVRTATMLKHPREDIVDCYFQQAYDVAAEYLIDNMIKNGIKSEILTLKNRIHFIHIILKLFENEDDLSDRGLEVLNRFYGSLDQCLDEIYAKISNLSLLDLFQVATVFSYLTDEVSFHFAKKDSFIFTSDDFMDRFYQFIEIIKTLQSKNPFDPEQAWAYLKLIRSADQTIKLLQQDGRDEDVEEEAAWLYKQRPFYLQLLQAMPPEKNLALDYLRREFSQVGNLPESELPPPP